MNRVKMEDWICKTERLDKLSRKNLDALQLQRLNVLLNRLHHRGGIYQNLPQNLSSLSQLADLPFTTAQMLKDHPGQFLLCSQSEVSRVISETTSGTTGGAKRVFYSEKDLDNTIGFFASGIGEMVTKGERCLIAFPFSGTDGLGDLIARAVERLEGIPIRAGFGRSYRELCQILKEEQPETYIGFPVPLLSLMRFYGKEFPIKRALLSGDACPSGVMDALGGLDHLYPHYGSRETVLGGAVTCEAFHGMHLRENHIIAEIIDDNGRVLPDGCWGELVITTIAMEAMPLLRYRTGDLTRILPEPCPCGGITRRLDQVIRKEQGPISIEALDSTLFTIPEIIDYRAEFGDHLYLDFLTKGSFEGKAAMEKVRELYPNLEISITNRQVVPGDRPVYLGKRQVILLKERLIK